MDMTSTLQRARPEASSRRASVPVTVAVGHKSTMIAAGLAATLARTPGCDVRLARISPDTCDRPGRRVEADVVFGDSGLLERVRGCVDPAAAGAKAKLVCVTAADEVVADETDTRGEVRLPLDCPEEELFALLRRLIGVDSSPSPTQAAIGMRAMGGLAPGALRRVREFVEQHITDKLRVDELAEIARLSLGHFNRAFRQSTGLSPHRYITERRVAAATDLLCNTTRALAEIALDVGFADQSHFSRTYMAVTGETPSACRRRHR
jgi:AraC-like DNA-binding protein